jgi:hypothetical protein
MIQYSKLFQRFAEHINRSVQFPIARQAGAQSEENAGGLMNDYTGEKSQNQTNS